MVLICRQGTTDLRANAWSPLRHYSRVTPAFQPRRSSITRGPARPVWDAVAERVQTLLAESVGFGELVDAALRELNNRLGDDLPSFLEPTFRPYRFIDSKEDAAANANAAVDAALS